MSELNGLRKLWETLLGICALETVTTQQPPTPSLQYQVRVTILLNFKKPSQTPLHQADTLQGM